MVCDAREKDVDIAFAQDAIDEFKVLSQLNLHNVYQILFVLGWKERKKVGLNIGSCVSVFF